MGILIIMKKVCFISQWPMHYHIPIYKMLSKLKNIDVTILYCDDITIKGYYENEMKANRDWSDTNLLDGYQHIFFKNYIKQSNNYKFLTLFNPGIIYHLLSRRYDVVNIRGYIGFTFIFALISSKLSSAKTIFQGETTLRNKENNFFKKVYLKIFFSFIDLAFYSCEGNKKFLDYYASGVRKVYAPCAVDNSYYQMQSKKFKDKVFKTRSSLGIGKNDIVVLTVGKIYARKRPLDILKAIKLTKNVNFVAVFVGDGDLKDTVKKFADEHGVRVVLPGYKTSKNVLPFYSIANIYAQVSEYDPSPKSLNESMNFGLPVVVTNTIGTSQDLVNPNINGYKVDVGDIEKISNSFIQLIDKKKRVKMGNESLKKINQFSIERKVNSMNKELEIL